MAASSCCPRPACASAPARASEDELRGPIGERDRDPEQSCRFILSEVRGRFGRPRAARVRTPVLILSGLDALNDKVKGLGFGADDFLTKPFDHRELVARIQAIIRRPKGHPETTIRTGKLLVNLDSRTVTVDDQPLHLTGKQFGMLELLSLRKGTALTKEMFLNHLYGGMDEPELKIIDVFICTLRKKLAQATGGEHYIETIWGRGYLLRATPKGPLLDRHHAPRRGPPNWPVRLRRGPRGWGLPTATRKCHWASPEAWGCLQDPGTDLWRPEL